MLEHEHPGPEGLAARGILPGGEDQGPGRFGSPHGEVSRQPGTSSGVAFGAHDAVGLRVPAQLIVRVAIGGEVVQDNECILEGEGLGLDGVLGGCPGEEVPGVEARTEVPQEEGGGLGSALPGGPDHVQAVVGFVHRGPEDGRVLGGNQSVGGHFPGAEARPDRHVNILALRRRRQTVKRAGVRGT
jgi:hypothetical protein